MEYIKLALLANVEHIAKGNDISTFYHIYGLEVHLMLTCKWVGSGITIALIIAVVLFSRKKEHKLVAKLAAPMGIFNINEPF